MTLKTAGDGALRGAGTDRANCLGHAHAADNDREPPSAKARDGHLVLDVRELVFKVEETHVVQLGEQVGLLGMPEGVGRWKERQPVGELAERTGELVVPGEGSWYVSRELRVFDDETVAGFVPLASTKGCGESPGRRLVRVFGWMSVAGKRSELLEHGGTFPPIEFTHRPPSSQGLRSLRCHTPLLICAPEDS